MAPPKTLKSKPKPQQRQKKPSRNARAGAAGSVNRMDTWDDTIEEGGADEFHKNRDKILLDDTTGSAKLRRALGEDDGDEFYDEEEVFRPTYDGGAAEEDEQELAEEDYAEEEPKARKERKRVLKERAAKGVVLPAKGRFAKADPTSSDEDGASDDDDDASDAGSGGGDDESDEEEETWGSNPSAYYARPSARRGRDDVDSDSDDEELAERRMLEEKEVRLQQRKAREGMSKGDWGLDDLEAAGADDVEEAKEDESAAAVVPAPETTDPAALLAHLRRHAPETLALANEWPALVQRLPVLAGAIQVKVKEDPEYKGLGMMSLHYQTYLTYTTTLAFYFHLASLPAETRPNLQTHPVLQRLLQLKEGLSQMENLDFAGDAEEDDDDESDPDEFAVDFEGESFGSEDEDDEDEDEPLDLSGAMDGKRDPAAEREWRRQMLEGLEEGELEGIMAEMARMQRGEPLDGSDDGEFDDDDFSDDLDEPAPAPVEKPKADKKAGKKQRAAAPAFPTIDEPTPSFSSKPKKAKASSSSASKRATTEADDALAEPTTLTAPDSSAKDAARHSLRFHTSKIESAASRRASARSGRMGGDDDVPYRNKQAGRDAALRKNSSAGANGAGDDDLDGEEWGEADKAAAKAVREMDSMDLDEGDDDDDAGDAGEGDDGYYQLVKKRKREEKEEKQAAYDDAREAERFVEDEAANGPRSLTRAILKNKGLTPTRTKAVRNPRVKKRMRFDKAKKQVASKQAVYSGGQSALKGAYGGEATGISQVVKSRKF